MRISRDDARKRELLRVCEVADLLGESRANIYLRIKRGEIRAVPFGKTLRVPAAPLFAMIDELVGTGEQQPAA